MKTAPDGKTWLFVYGTLRPNEGNFARMGGAEPRVLCANAQANGRMFNLIGAAPVYPVVNFNMAGKCVGDVLEMPSDSEWLRQADSMEIGAGYEPIVISVLDNNGELMDCVAYHFDTNRRRTGIYIEHGDWKRFARTDCDV